MQNLSRLALSLLSTLVVSSVFAQCAPGSPCYKGGSGNRGYGSYSGSYYGTSYDDGYSYGAPSYGSYESYPSYPMSHGHNYSYSQDYPPTGYSYSQPHYSFSQGGEEVYPGIPPQNPGSNTQYRSSWSSQPSYQSSWSSSPSFRSYHQGSYQKSYSAPMDQSMNQRPGSWSSQGYYNPNASFSTSETEMINDPNQYPPTGMQDTTGTTPPRSSTGMQMQTMTPNRNR